MKKGLYVLLGAVVAIIGLFGFMTYNAQTLGPKYVSEAEPALGPVVDADRVAQELAKAITFKTISTQDGEPDATAFEGFLSWFEATYPKIASLQSHDFTYSRVYVFPGRNPDLMPMAMMGHYDVVPVIPGTEDQWTHPPYEGVIAGGYLWGRGAVDMKGPTITLMHAVERMMEKNFMPERTIYLILHHDEEIGGRNGAVKIGEWLKAQGIRLILAYDEGGVISQGMVPGVAKPVAMIGVGEKGYVTFRITSHGPGGHSSMPPRDTTVGRLARALMRLEASPFPGGLEGAVEETYTTLAPELPFAQRFALGNPWALGWLTEATMATNKSADASLRTTYAPTMLDASLKENVLPITATAIVNSRIHPRDSIQSVKERMISVIADPEITVEIEGFSSEPSPFSDTGGPVWRTLVDTLKQIHPDHLVAPYMTVGATDSRHYRLVSDNVYRFSPFTMTPEMSGGAHGTNEKILVSDLEPMVRFYTHLIRNTHHADAFGGK